LELPECPEVYESAELSSKDAYTNQAKENAKSFVKKLSTTLK